MKTLIAAVLAATVSGNVLASDFQFENISRQDLERIVGDFSANFSHTAVSGADPLGDIWGVELGLIGGVAGADEIDAIFARENVAAEADFLPHGGVLGRLGMPFGLTLEGSFFPEVGDSDFEFSTRSAALMWSRTVTPLINVGIKGHVARTDIGFVQAVGGTDNRVDYENSVRGIELIASGNLPLFKPYAGIGRLRGDGDMRIAGTSTFFNFTAAQSASAEDSDTEIFVGVELDLLLNFAVEYANRFGENSYTAKFSINF